MNLDSLLVRPRHDEAAASLPGDDVIAQPDVVMDRAFDIPAPVAQVWPWFVQLGKRRAGWYLPRWVEVAISPRRRGLRRLDPTWQQVRVGDVIPDWGGAHATFEAVKIEPPTTLVYGSTRGALRLTWAITLSPQEPDGTRVHLRLRLAGVRHTRLARYGGGFVDLLTVAGLAAGLRERLAPGTLP